MENAEKALPQAGRDIYTQNPPGNPEIDGKDRVFLLGTLAFCILMTDTFLLSLPGLGITVTVWAWYVLTLSYLGKGRLRSGESRFLLLVNLLLAATFALTSNGYFRLWNLGALLVLLPVHAFSLTGAVLRPWWRPSMLTQRLALLFRGLFGNLHAVGAAVTGTKKGPWRRAWVAVAGACAALAMVLILLPVLSSADALFSHLTHSFWAFCVKHLTAGLARFLIGFGLTPFMFGLLYSLRRPVKTAWKEVPSHTADCLLFEILLTAMTALYLVFLCVQATGLFGGAAFLEQRGISYANWARSGFFQMVGVTVVNLTVTLTALNFSARGGRGWRAVRGLATVLVAESFLLLASAFWRMSLYVSAYGLSFKRIMTYWGMAMMAVFLLAALLAVWKNGFSFYRAAFAAAVLGWLLINCVPADYLVARDSVSRYLDGKSPVVDVTYLTSSSLSYDSLNQLARLDGSRKVLAYDKTFYDPNLSLADFLASRRESARNECAKWERWNLSAYLAGGAA